MIVCMPGEKVTRGEWERIFGKDSTRKRKLRDKRGQVLNSARKACDTAQRKAPAVCDDRPWGRKGIWYPCLGERVYSRADERAKFKRANIVHIG